MKLFLATPIYTFSDPEEYNAYRKTVVHVSLQMYLHHLKCISTTRRNTPAK